MNEWNTWLPYAKRCAKAIIASKPRTIIDGDDADQIVAVKLWQLDQRSDFEFNRGTVAAAVRNVLEDEFRKVRFGKRKGRLGAMLNVDNLQLAKPANQEDGLPALDLAKLTRKLNQRQRRIVALKCANISQTAIGREFGVNESRIVQIVGEIVKSARSEVIDACC